MHPNWGVQPLNQYTQRVPSGVNGRGSPNSGSVVGRDGPPSIETRSVSLSAGSCRAQEMTSLPPGKTWNCPTVAPATSGGSVGSGVLTRTPCGAAHGSRASTSKGRQDSRDIGNLHIQATAFVPRRVGLVSRIGQAVDDLVAPSWR